MSKKPNRGRSAANPLNPGNRPPAPPPAPLSAPPTAIEASFVLNSAEIPSSLSDFIKATLMNGGLVTLFPIVRAFSATLNPLEFGKAMQLAINPHGQIKVRYLINFDRTVEVEVPDEELVLGDVSEINALWKTAFEESWKHWNDCV